MEISKVTVLMPVYNAEKYLADAIESILSQTFSNFEFIISNDGSTDNSLDIIQKYAMLDQRIKVIDRNNRGIIFTRNEGLRESNCEYIALMDADDISLPTRLEQQVNFLNTHPEHVAIGCQVILIDEDGDILSPFKVMINHEEIDGAHLKGLGGAIINPSSMFRKNSALEINGYRDHYSYAEDFDFWLRLGEHGYLGNLPDALVYYRQHIESVGYAQRKEQLENTITAVLDACKRRNIEVAEEVLLLRNNLVVPNELEIYIKWGWWAFNGKNYTAARKYAFKTIRLSLFNGEAWKLLACSLRGH